ncbi:MAG: prepilin peptidase [Anaerolineales bacterium]|nr:prepilin peptidase [Anaerolineales bacterium]
MWSSNLDLFAHLIVLFLMTAAGIQDLKTREVSNYITIPFFFAGLIANMIRAFSDIEMFRLLVLFQAAVILAGYYGWMGGADMKVFGGLLGLFPFAGIVAFIASGIVGAVVWGVTQRRDATFPAVAVSAFVVALALPWF